MTYTHPFTDAQMAELRAHVEASPRRRIVRVTIEDADDEIVEAMARAQIAAEAMNVAAPQTAAAAVSPPAPKRGRPPKGTRPTMSPAERDAAKRLQSRVSMARMRARRKAENAVPTPATAPETAPSSMVVAEPMPAPSWVPPGAIPPYAQIRSGTCWWRPRS
jgi:hypothetical protein